MKIFFILAAVTMLFSTIIGQNTVDKSSTCSEQDVKRISSRGIRFGMDQEEVIRQFSENGGLTGVRGEYLQEQGRTRYTYFEDQAQAVLAGLQSMAARNFGYSVVSLAPKDKTRFEGIAHYDLGFLDKKLSFLRVNYLKPKWKDQEQFIQRVSEVLNLRVPKSSFDGRSLDRFQCGTYSVGFTQSFNDEIRSSFQISAPVNEITQERRRKAEDEEREKDIKGFKP